MPKTRPSGDRVADPAPAGSGRKITHNLTALSSAAVLAVYSAGYLRTRAAAEQFEHAAVPRQPDGPAFLSPASGRPALRPAAAAAPSAPVDIAPQPSPSTTTPSTMPSTSVPAHKDVQPATSAAAPSEPMAASADTHAVAPSEEALAVAASAAPAQPAAATQPVPTSAPADPSATMSQAQATAPAAAAPSAAAAKPAAPRFKDGVYKGWGSCRHGDIEAAVTITDGRILSAAISQCWTRYSCSWISPLPPQVAARQSAEVDYVSGATESTYAFYYAVLEALHKARSGQ